MKMMVQQLNFIVLLIFAGLSHSLFVPEQLPTLLSFIYTNIPPVRKGTDSRIGLGFRLGPNADFQVLFELGPQQNTLPLGPSSATMSTSKRETSQVPVKNPTWLQLWKQQATEETDNDGESNNIPVLDEDVVNHLKQLYKEQPKDVSTNDTEAKSNITEQS